MIKQDRVVEEKLKKSLLKKTFENSPFDMEVFALNKWRKPLQEMGKTSLKTHLKSCVKQPKTAPIHRPPKTSRWGPTQQEILLLVDRPVDRPTVRFLTAVPPVDRPVDWAKPIGRPALPKRWVVTVSRQPGRPAF